jgi:hypothetical protein
MRSLLAILLLLTVGAAWADPPMKVVYQKTSSATFGWYWPYKTTHTTTEVSTYPSPMGSGYRQLCAYYPYEDVSQYRFHNSHRTYHDQWGYFFPEGTRPIRVGSGSAFVTPHTVFIQSR